MIARAAVENLRSLATLFYPPACVACGVSVDDSQYLCASCQNKIARIVPPFCAKCSEPFDGAISTEFACANCGQRTLSFNAAVAAYRSRGVVRHVVLKFKYGREMRLRHIVGQWLCDAFKDARLAGRTFEMIVPVPLHPARERDRGFNQAALLAQIASERLAVPCRPVLQRIRFTTTQTAFDRAERMDNLRDAFRLRRRADVRGCRVLLVDDILTTGSTLSECARVLKSAGASSVFAVTAARA